MTRAALHWFGAGCITFGVMLLLSLVMVDGTPVVLAHGTPTPGAADAEDDHDHPSEIAASVENPTYYEHVEPILQENCIACHTGDDIGQAVFDMSDTRNILTSYEDIARVVWDRYMPPWMPGENSPPMRHERRLSEDDRAVILTWADNDAPLGPAPENPEPFEPERVTIEPDLIVEMPEPYTPAADVYDDYRCFLIDLELEEDRYISAFDVVPGERSIVHHVVVYQVPDRARVTANARDIEYEGPGWACYGGPNVGLDAGLGDSVGTWTPGALPVIFPEGTGRTLKADSLLVLQVHYNLEAGAATDQTRVLFQLAEEGADITPVQLFTMFAPVELPCPVDAEHPDCDRDTAIANAFAAGKSDDVAFTNWLLRQCDLSEGDFVNQDPANIASTCEFRAPLDADVIGVLAHMHTHGTAFRIEVNPGTDAAQTLLEIPRWDFNWQGEYLYVEPVRINRGDTIRMTCTWDNSEGDRYIIWGEGTGDEMCIGWLAATLP